ncbi:unnamed protein product [Fraxinus pennsylvanica]|uniref:Uncharacterized protein n=1 Tax=Fraxinus pennsylvanica TaxID=56036 RepID=A0AAD1YSL4_9LAMI|nr:unnamed protein product [Fraxinus pennsylvanica]
MAFGRTPSGHHQAVKLLSRNGSREQSFDFLFPLENSYECPNKVKDVSLQELRDMLQEFAKVRGWDQYHSPRNILLALEGLGTHSQFSLNPIVERPMPRPT